MTRTRAAVAVLLLGSALTLCAVLAGETPKETAELPKDPAVKSAAEAALDQASADGKFAFLVFSRIDTTATRTMTQGVKDFVAAQKTKAAYIAVKVADPAEKDLVQRFDVSRAPMPLTLVVAPNGAVTGVFSRPETAEHLAAALVTPTMTRCMKSLQAGKLVLVCVHKAAKAPTPAAVQEFLADPHFKDRTVVESFQENDPREAKFLTQMQLDPAGTKGSTTVFLAPPGVLIGKFDLAATKDDLGAALAKAGKCCDDPNCKHNHSPAPTQPAASQATRKASEKGSVR